MNLNEWEVSMFRADFWMGRRGTLVAILLLSFAGLANGDEPQPPADEQPPAVADQQAEINPLAQQVMDLQKQTSENQPVPKEETPQESANANAEARPRRPVRRNFAESLGESEIDQETDRRFQEMQKAVNQEPLEAEQESEKAEVQNAIREANQTKYIDIKSPYFIVSCIVGLLLAIFAASWRFR
ncbi:hypothetical protein GC197_09315 [bacterium]|nr:hypothetical protein [bacterium]